MIMVIVVLITVPLPQILRGQDNNREAGGTDLPDLHTGQDGDDGVAHGDDDNRLALQWILMILLDPSPPSHLGAPQLEQ